MLRPNLRLLEVFRVVYEHQSVTSAANSLNVTQPAVSKAVHQLEAELGLSLFCRVQGRLRPTQDGERLYGEATRLFEQVALFRNSLKDLTNGKLGKVVAGGVPTLACSLLTTAASRILIDRPMLKLEICAAQSASVLLDASHHRIDFGLTHAPATNDTLVSRLIGESEIVAAVPVSHPLARRDSVSPCDLIDTPIIMLDSGSPPSHFVREAFHRADAPLNVAMETNSSAIAYAAACDGAGIALIDPWAGLCNPRDNVMLLRFTPTIPLRIYVVYSALRAPSRIAQELLLEVRKQIEKQSRRSGLVRVFSGEGEFARALLPGNLCADQSAVTA